MWLEGFSINLFIFTVLGACGMVSAALMRQVRLVVGRRMQATLELRNERMRRRYDQMRATHEAAVARIAELETERRMTVGQIQEMKRRLLAAKQESFEIVHELGEPGGDRRPFVGDMTLGPMLTVGRVHSGDSRVRGLRHVLEVWAATPAEATRLARLAFAPDAGFTVPPLQPAVPGRPARKAAE
ncbi:hypothetical protein [Rhodocista pekingensis]|uniref:Uncharacterized protein n=1 Tax=Rhodocista pekingensis TaxID=201185 RepID=A0ABW2KX85_9PROT